MGLLRAAWSDLRLGGYVRATSVCLSSLLAGDRHQELLEELTLQRFPSWHDRGFGVQAPVSQGRIEEALAYAEASRGLNRPDTCIDDGCERILLDLGRLEEASPGGSIRKVRSDGESIVDRHRHFPGDAGQISWPRPQEDSLGSGRMER